jgi:hypothetical protein
MPLQCMFALSVYYYDLYFQPLDLLAKCLTKLERLARDKRSSLFGIVVSGVERNFHNIDFRCQCNETLCY